MFVAGVQRNKNTWEPRSPDGAEMLISSPQLDRETWKLGTFAEVEFTQRVKQHGSEDRKFVSVAFLLIVEFSQSNTCEPN